jgi:hypothetical protein
MMVFHLETIVQVPASVPLRTDRSLFHGAESHYHEFSVVNLAGYHQIRLDAFREHL